SSFSLGILASCAAPSHNLGFMAKTESQVERHLNGHLEKLPAMDHCSRSIVEQMRADEIGRRTSADGHGARRLPFPVRALMRGMSRIMTMTAYRIWSAYFVS